MDKRLAVSREDRKCWTLLERIDEATLDLVKFFKPHNNRLYAVLNDGRFIAVGDNSEGLLGLGHKQVVKTFQEVRKLKGKRIKDIICGRNFVMVLTEDGQVWGWGQNEHGQLGTGDQVEHLVPRRILDGDIIEVKCGWQHTLALKKDGKVMGWGRNGFSQIGIGNTDDQLAPVPIVFLEDVVIDQIETGEIHSIAVSKVGKAYGWGYNWWYQLGLGHRFDVYRPTLIDVHNKPIKSVACSGVRTLFLARDGLMYQTIPDNGRIQLLRLEADVCTKHIACACNVYRGFLFVSWTNSELYYWRNTKQGTTLDPIPTDLSLSQVISKHSRRQVFPTVLYLQQEDGGTMMEVASDAIRKEQFGQNCLNVSQYFDSPEFSDIEFIFPDHRSIKAHRLVLSAASSHLATELRTTWQSLARVPITSHPYPVFHQYLSYLYTHTLSIDDIDQLVSLVQLAQDYHELDLQQVCVRLLSEHLNIDNCSRVYELAVDLQLEQVETQASKMIIHHIGQVKRTYGYQKMSVENAKKLLETKCT